MAQCRFCERKGLFVRVDDKDLCAKCQPEVGAAWDDYRRTWLATERAVADDKEAASSFEQRSPSSKPLLLSVARHQRGVMAQALFGGPSLGHPYDDVLEEILHRCAQAGYLYYWNSFATAGRKAPDTSDQRADVQSFFGDFSAMWELSKLASQPMSFRVACVFNSRAEYDATAQKIPKIRNLPGDGRKRVVFHLADGMLGGYLLAGRERQEFSLVG